MNNLKISVIIPVYNREKYVFKCVKSITNQTFKNLEIICVNDGSSDNSLKILENLQKNDERIIVINQKNHGASNARNNGLKKATGNYIIFVDGDDWLELTCLEECYNKIVKFDLDMVAFGFKEEYFNNKINEISMDLMNFTDKDIISGEEYFINFLKKRAFQSSCNKLIKREILTKNKIFFMEKVFQNEDALFLANIAKHIKKIGKIDKPFYHYRKGSNNGSSKIKEKYMKDISIVFFEIEKLYSDKEKMLTLINERRVINMFEILINKEYQKFNYYFTFKNEFLNRIKKVNESFINSDINLNKKTQFSLSFLKLFPYHSVVKILTLLKNISNFIKRDRELK